MKKTWIIVVAILALVVIFCVTSYNSLVSKEEAVETAWSNVENQYQRRADLIPNLVNTVKGYADHEKETLDAVVSARAKATQTSVSLDELTPERMAAFQKVQGELSSALSRLLVTVERYPDLKANQNFQTLQAQLEGTENRISVERRNFNQVTQDYNTAAFRLTSLLRCSDSRNIRTLKQKRVRRKLPKLNSKRYEAQAAPVAVHLCLYLAGSARIYGGKPAHAPLAG